MKKREIRRCYALALLATSALALLGCSRYGTVKKRFAYDYSCKEPLKVQPVAGAKYVVRGCDRTATYVCVNAVCLEERRDPAPVRASAYGARAQSQSANVTRSFDEKTGEDRVRGTFSVSNGVRVTLVSIPARELETVYVRLVSPGYLVPATCTSFDLLINKRPVTSGTVDFTNQNGRMAGGDRFQFQDFRPLASRYPEFAVRLCGKELAFTEAQIASLQKFLVIHSELAETVQSGQVEPSSGTTL